MESLGQDLVHFGAFSMSRFVPLALGLDWKLLIKCGYSLRWDQGALLYFGWKHFGRINTFLETFFIWMSSAQLLWAPCGNYNMDVTYIAIKREQLVELAHVYKRKNFPAELIKLYFSVTDGWGSQMTF